ncbi:MAG: rhodoquinone biosynthesis methyltransferase RquA [Rhodospirillaceae bacterium]
MMSKDNTVIEPFISVNSKGMVSHSPMRVEAVVSRNVRVPAYLTEVYSWAYLNPVATKFFNHQAVVTAILWGNYGRLFRAVLEELRPGQRVLQLASVYGPFSARLAEALGPTGRLDVVEVAPIQVARCQRQLERLDNVRVILGDAASPPEGYYDVVLSFFLLHEVPEDYKVAIVEAALARLAPGGRAVFIDYHRPVWWHPLRPIMALVFDWLEPFARALLAREIKDYAPSGGPRFSWFKQIFFGGLYQKSVASSPAASKGAAV